jgi:hypothetical protein
MWNPIGFHVLKALQKGRKFNAQYYTNDILVSISDWRRQTEGTRRNKLWVHSDNARPHNAKMSKGLHRSQSNETSTSSPLFARFGTLGLFPFGDVKGKLMGYRAETPSELPVRIRVILAEIPHETLNAAFSRMDGVIAKMLAGR